MEITVKVVSMVSEYDLNEYPGDGLYINSNTSNLIQVDGSIITVLWSGLNYNKYITANNQSGNIKESTLLKTIAIMQSPELIKDI